MSKSRGRSRQQPTIQVYRPKPKPGEIHIDTLYKRRAFLRKMGKQRTAFQTHEMEALNWALKLLVIPDSKHGYEP